MLSAKLQKVRVTDANVNYKGSITIDPDLMDKLGVLEYEQCIINGMENRDNITYVIPGVRGSGQIEINGALSTKHKAGDFIHVLFFEVMPIVKKPKIILTDEHNKFMRYL